MGLFRTRRIGIRPAILMTKHLTHVGGNQIDRRRAAQGLAVRIPSARANRVARQPGDSLLVIHGTSVLASGGGFTVLEIVGELRSLARGKAVPADGRAGLRGG